MRRTTGLITIALLAATGACGGSSAADRTPDTAISLPPGSANDGEIYQGPGTPGAGSSDDDSDGSSDESSPDEGDSGDDPDSTDQDLGDEDVGDEDFVIDVGPDDDDE